MAENLANTSCSGILNVRTKKFAQTSKRDQLIRSIGKLFSQSVNRNKLAQSDSRVEIANDAIMQFNEAREDYVNRLFKGCKIISYCKPSTLEFFKNKGFVEKEIITLVEKIA